MLFKLAAGIALLSLTAAVYLWLEQRMNTQTPPAGWVAVRGRIGGEIMARSPGGKERQTSFIYDYEGQEYQGTAAGMFFPTEPVYVNPDNPDEHYWQLPSLKASWRRRMARQVLNYGSICAGVLFTLAIVQKCLKSTKAALFGSKGSSAHEKSTDRQ